MAFFFPLSRRAVPYNGRYNRMFKIRTPKKKYRAIYPRENFHFDDFDETLNSIFLLIIFVDER